jgi:hypothetical protein
MRLKSHIISSAVSNAKDNDSIISPWRGITTESRDTCKIAEDSIRGNREFRSNETMQSHRCGAYGSSSSNESAFGSGGSLREDGGDHAEILGVSRGAEPIGNFPNNFQFRDLHTTYLIKTLTHYADAIF